MRNTFIPGKSYNAAQNISRLALANNHTPLFYQGLVYVGSESTEGDVEHEFTYEGKSQWFEDSFINNGKVEDNGWIFAEQKV
jgi:hypothetical protein